MFDLSGLSEYEQQGLKAMLPELQKSIQAGVDFAKSN